MYPAAGTYSTTIEIKGSALQTNKLINKESLKSY
jgi:hypothetical protein